MNIKEINPLYLVALFVALVFAVVLKLTSLNEAYLAAKSDYYALESKTKELESLKQKWGFDAKSMVESIQSSTNESGERLEVVYAKNTATFRLKSQSVYAVESLLNKILNQPFIIKKINIIEGKEFEFVCVVNL